MPKDDINYRFTEGGIVYDFYDVFVPAEFFSQPSLFSWGRNASGEIGVNDTNNRSTPVTTFSGGGNWKQSSGGRLFSAAIKTDGSLWTWGGNSYGQLGVNDTTQRNTPITTLAGGNNWKSIFSGGRHITAIKTDGTLWTWGLNTTGQLGINDTSSRSTPVTTILGGTNWKQVSGGYSHTAAIKTDGTLWTWGLNTNGQLGTNDTTQRNTPVTTFAGGTNWQFISCGWLSTNAIKTDGTLWTWGDNVSGQLGTNDTTQRNTPVTTFAGGNNWKLVSGGSTHTAAIKTDGTLWIWGSSAFGQLGTNDTTLRNTPVTTFAGGNNWKFVSCSNVYSAAIKTDGTLWTWGRNNIAQLGVNDTTQRNTPVTTFAGGNNWKSVSSGGYFISAIEYRANYNL